MVQSWLLRVVKPYAEKAKWKVGVTLLLTAARKRHTFFLLALISVQPTTAANNNGLYNSSKQLNPLCVMPTAGPKRPRPVAVRHVRQVPAQHNPGDEE
jgi:hypothetical protein